MLIPFEYCANVLLAINSEKPLRVLHVGAHTGEEAAAYSRCGVKEVIWVEPNFELIDELRESISKFPMRQQILPLALWDSNSELILNITNNTQSSSMLELHQHRKYYPQIEVVNSTPVKAFRFDTLLAQKPSVLISDNVDFVNIDTQGAELRVLKGMGEFLRAGCIKGIYAEVNIEEMYAGIPMVSDIDNYLAEFEFFRVRTILTRQGWGDALYVRGRVG